MKIKSIISIIAVIAIAACFIACASAPASTAAPAGGSPARSAPASDPDIAALDGAVEAAFTRMSANLTAGLTIALLPINAADRDRGNYAYENITIMFFDTLIYDMVERNRINEIIKEQNLQYSGLVDDRTAAEIGKFLGAQVIIIGDITGSGATRRLVFRALDVETARIMALAQERF